MKKRVLSSNWYDLNISIGIMLVFRLCIPDHNPIYGFSRKTMCCLWFQLPAEFCRQCLRKQDEGNATLDNSLSEFDSKRSHRHKCSQRSCFPGVIMTENLRRKKEMEKWKEIAFFISNETWSTKRAAEREEGLVPEISIVEIEQLFPGILAYFVCKMQFRYCDTDNHHR